MVAVFAFDPGKAVEEIAAIQIPLHNLFDMGAKEAVSPFKTIFIDLLQGFQVVFNAAIVRGLLGISGSIYGERHGPVTGECTDGARPIFPLFLNE